MDKRFLLLIWLFLSSTAAIGQTSTGFAPSEGVDLYYETYGEGQPMVIINGGPGFNCKGFQGLAKRLAQQYRVILYDQRGTGRSVMEQIDSTRMTMGLMVADLEALRKHLGFQEWTVLGHSFGGILGNYYAAQHPASLKALIASASGGIDLTLLRSFDLTQRMTTAQRDSFQYWTAQASAGDTSAWADARRRAFMATAYVYDDAHAPRVAERLGQGNPQINQLIWQDLQRIGYSVQAAAGTFEKPVLVIQGEQDVVSLQIAEKAHEAYPNSRLEILPECGHYGWLDQPERYFSALAGFMQQVAEEDEQQIRQVLENYVRSIYEADTALVYEVTNSRLQKSGHYYATGSGQWVYSNMSFQQLVRTAARYNRQGTLPENAPLKIEVFDIGSRTASAKVAAIWGYDYVLLSQNDNGQWRMDKVLWQSYSPEAQQDRQAIGP